MQQARMKEVANHYSRRGFYIKGKGLGGICDCKWEHAI